MKTNFLFIHKGLTRKQSSYKYRALQTAECCPSHLHGWTVSLHRSLISQKPLLNKPQQVCEGPSYLNQYQAKLSKSICKTEKTHIYWYGRGTDKQGQVIFKNIVLFWKIFWGHSFQICQKCSSYNLEIEPQ